VSSALVRAVDPIALQALKNSMADDQRLYLEAKDGSRVLRRPNNHGAALWSFSARLSR
jgi:hypothetical protein